MRYCDPGIDTQMCCDLQALGIHFDSGGRVQTTVEQATGGEESGTSCRVMSWRTILAEGLCKVVWGRGKWCGVGQLLTVVWRRGGPCGVGRCCLGSCWVVEDHVEWEGAAWGRMGS